ncbi:MAG: hypothetical protein P8L78_18485 [Mariniblastus sp.]|nr:hypothetical protein [Mariniblastus sp.]
MNNASVMRASKWTVVCIAAGSCLISIAPISVALTSIEMDAANWQFRCTARMVYMFTTLFGGFFLIALGLFKCWRLLAKIGLVVAVCAAVSTYYPSVLQLQVGPQTYEGELIDVTISPGSTRNSFGPNSLGRFTRQPPAEIKLKRSDGSVKTIKVYPGDLVKEFKTSPISLAGRWKFVVLVHFQRLLSVERIAE